MCIEFYIVKIVYVCALMACSTFHCLVTHLLVHRMYAHMYVCRCWQIFGRKSCCQFGERQVTSQDGNISPHFTALMKEAVGLFLTLVPVA